MTAIFFFLFSQKTARKQNSKFHANCLLKSQFAWNVKFYLLEKRRKTCKKLCTEFFASIPSIKEKKTQTMDNIPLDFIFILKTNIKNIYEKIW